MIKIFIGLTGGIATGKSTVTKLLNQFGAITISADQIAHKLMQPKQELWYEVVNYFGKEILLDNQQINRDKLAKIIFNDTQKREKLDQITHPVIIKQLKAEMDKHKASKEIVVVEVPLLFEADMTDMFTEVWVVYTTKEIQLKRLMKRDQISKEEALKKIRSQMSLEEKKEAADRVIENNLSRDKLEEELANIWEEIK